MYRIVDLEAQVRWPGYLCMYSEKLLSRSSPLSLLFIINCRTVISHAQVLVPSAGLPVPLAGLTCRKKRRTREHFKAAHLVTRWLPGYSPLGTCKMLLSRRQKRSVYSELRRRTTRLLTGSALQALAPGRRCESRHCELLMYLRAVGHCIERMASIE